MLLRKNHITSLTTAAAAALILLSTPLLAKAQTPTANILKNDGSFFSYKLLPVHFDPRHASAVEMRANKTLLNPAPDSYQIASSYLPPVRDQGQRGTCAYFATVGLVEASYIAKDPNFSANHKVSEECLVDLRNWESDTDSYKAADKPDQRPDPNGDLPKSIILTVNKYGVPEALAYKTPAVSCVYDGSNSNGGSVSSKDYSSVVTASTAYGKSLNFVQDTAPTIEQLKKTLSQNIPVEIGIVVYNEYMNGTDWRFDDKLDIPSNAAGGHAIILTGYTTKDAQTIFTFKNSWSDSWGNAGYGTIDDKIVTNSWKFDPEFDFTVSISN